MKKNTTSIWSIIRYHNRRKWRRNIMSMTTNILSLSAMLLLIQLGLGVEHFFGVVNHAIAGAKIIKIDLSGSIIIDPSQIETNWSFWNPGQQLVITDQSVGTVRILQTVLHYIFLSVGGLFFLAGLWTSRQLSELEFRSREHQYKTMFWHTCDPSWVIRLASTQKILFSVIAIAIAIPVANLGMARYTVMKINQAVPGMDIFFSLSWSDLVWFVPPLLGQLFFGWLFTRWSARQFVRKLI